MTGLRRLLRSHRALAAFVVAAALALRLLVPAGFMPTMEGGRLVISICSGFGPAKTMEMTGATHAGMEHHGNPDGDRAQSPCAFADLALPVIGGMDPIQLAAAIVFVMAAGLVLATALPPRLSGRLRPPLRGPPALG